MQIMNAFKTRALKLEGFINVCCGPFVTRRMKAHASTDHSSSAAGRRQGHCGDHQPGEAAQGLLVRPALP